MTVSAMGSTKEEGNKILCFFGLCIVFLTRLDFFFRLAEMNSRTFFKESDSLVTGVFFCKLVLCSTSSCKISKWSINRSLSDRLELASYLKDSKVQRGNL